MREQVEYLAHAPGRGAVVRRKEAARVQPQIAERQPEHHECEQKPRHAEADKREAREQVVCFGVPVRGGKHADRDSE